MVLINGANPAAVGTEDPDCPNFACSGPISVLRTFHNNAFGLIQEPGRRPKVPENEGGFPVNQFVSVRGKNAVS